MKMFSRMILGVACMMTLATTARAADVTATISDMHICCPGCAKSIEGAAGGVEGVKATVDPDSLTTTLTGPEAEVKKAISAIAAKGFHGTVEPASLAMKDDSGAKPGKVAKLTCSGAHNCCGACVKAIQGAAEGVEGVTKVDCKPKTESFTVEGDFDATALVKALNEAGFHVTVK